MEGDVPISRRPTSDETLESRALPTKGNDPVGYFTATVDRARALFKQLLENSGAGVVVIEKGQRITFASRTFEKALGYKSGGLIGKTVKQITHADDKKLRQRLGASQPAQIGKSKSVEGRFIAKDGCEKWCRVAVASFGGSSGRSRLKFALIEDVTERKEAHDTVELSEMLFRHTFEDAGIGMAIVDRDGNIERINRELRRLLGYPKKSLIGRPLSKFFHKDQDTKQIDPTKLLASKRDRSPVHECQFVTKERKTIWGQLSCAVVRHEDGTPRHIICCVQDITKHKAAEIALGESERRFRNIFENAAVGMNIADLDGQIVMANRAFCRMLGYTKAQFKSMTVADLTHPDDLKVAMTRRKKLIADAKSDGSGSEIRLFHRDGSIVWGALTRSVLTDLDGNVVFTIGQVQDITERKHAEDMLQRYNDIMAEIARGADIREILTLIAETVDEVGEGAASSLILVDRDRNCFRLAAAPKLPKYVRNQIDGMPIDPTVGSCGAAVTSGKTSIVADLTTGADAPSLKPLIDKAGLLACWSVPIRVTDGGIVGAIATFYKEKRKPTKRERVAVEAAANVAGIAIERSKALEALREREQRFRDFANVTADMFWETDQHHRFTYISHDPGRDDGSESSLDDRIYGKTPWGWGGQDTADEDWRRKCREAMEAGQPLRDFRFQTTGESGTPRYFRINGAPFYDWEGNFGGYRGTAVDETSEVEARTNERTIQRQFLDAMESLTEGFVLWDKHDRFVTCNSYYKKLRPGIGHLLIPGTRFDDFIQALADSDDIDLQGADPEEWVAYRIKAHRDNKSSVLETKVGDRWFEVRKQRLDDGSTIVFYADVTEARARAEEMRQSEAKYRLLFERANDSIFLVDFKSGKFVDANKRAAERLGYTREELLELTIYDISPFTDPAATRLIHRSLDKNGVAMAERVHKRKDGSLMDVEITSHVLELNGRPVVQTFARDITERKRAERAVRESEQRFKDFAKSAADRFWETDENHRMIYVSDTPDGSPMVAPENLLGKARWERPYVEPDEAAWEAHRQTILARKPFRDFAYTTINDAGEPLYLKSSGAPYYDEEGRFRGYRGTTVNETATVLERRKASDIQARFLDAIENITEGVALWDNSDRLVMCNSFFRQLNKEVVEYLQPGETFEAIMRQIAYKGIYPDWAGKEDEHIRNALDHHRKESSEYEWQSGNIWMRMRSQRLSDGSTISFLTDVTDAHRREEALRQAQKMEAVGQLTGGIAHDFNNLLAAILGNLELVANNLENDPENANRARRAINSVMRGVQLTDRLLAFSRKQALEPEPTDTNGMLIGMLDLLQRSLGETIKIHMKPAAGLWQTLVDQAQLENAVLNLAINARDAMPDGGELTFETANVVVDDQYRKKHPYAELGEYISLSVRDTGTGIAPDVLERVFEPFFTTKGIGEGSGLGLSMVFGFVKQSNGHVDIESELNVGTTVTLFLPKANSVVETVADYMSYDVEFEGHGERVLVVEDDSDVLDVTMTMLNDLGYQPICATNGEDALSLIERQAPIHVLLTDIVLPGGRSGLDIASAVSKNHPDVKVMLMTGYSDRTAIEVRENGQNGEFVTLDKPFTLHDLGAKLHALLDAVGHRPVDKA